MMTAITSLQQRKTTDLSAFCSTASETLVVWSNAEESAITTQVNPKVHIGVFFNAHINQYVFCGDNPVMFVDPSGLKPDEDNKGLKRKYMVLSGADYLKQHEASVAAFGFWGDGWPLISGGYFGGIVDIKLVYEGNPNVMYILDGVLYTPSEMGNIAAGRTAANRGRIEFLAVKYGGELFVDVSGFKQGWNSSCPCPGCRVFTSIFMGFPQLVRGARGSWEMNDLGRRRAQKGQGGVGDR